MNALGLNDRRRHEGGSMRCDLCGWEREDLIHFLIECEGLESRRDRTFLRRLGGEDAEETVGRALFETEGEDLETVKRMIQDLWFARKAKRAIGGGRDMRGQEAGGRDPERR